MPATRKKMVAVSTVFRSLHCNWELGIRANGEHRGHHDARQLVLNREIYIICRSQA